MQLRPDARALRATSTIARTLYRELRRADYSREDVLRLVNEMVDLLTHDARTPAPVGPLRLAPTLDRETGLPNAAVMREVLEFELGHARDGQDLLVIALDVEMPALSAEPAVHEAIAEALRKNVRANETVGRTAPGRYLVLVPRATLDVARPLLRRLGTALAGVDALRARGVRIAARAAVHDAGVRSVEDLLERVGAAMPIAVFPAPAAPVRTSGDGRRVTLALGGGAARALAHVGVLRVLGRAGVRVSGIAGTSAGALVGALHAMGVEEGAIAARFAELTRTPIYSEMRRAYARLRPRGRSWSQSTLSLLSNERRAALPDELLTALVEHFVGPDRTIQGLRLPFAACTTDLVEGRMVVLGYGSLHTALRATCAIPGLFAPQADGDRLLVDGSVVSEVPIAAAQKLGLTAPVMAVYLQRPTAAPPLVTSSEIAVRASALVHTQLVREQLRSVPLLVTVPVGDISWLSFRDGAKIVRVGEEAAEAALPGILAQLDAEPARA